MQPCPRTSDKEGASARLQDQFKSIDGFYRGFLEAKVIPNRTVMGQLVSIESNLLVKIDFGISVVKKVRFDAYLLVKIDFGINVKKRYNSIIERVTSEQIMLKLRIRCIIIISGITSHNRVYIGA